MDNSIPFKELLGVLTDLVHQKASGTLFIRSDNNHVVTIVMDKGRIHAMYHGPKRGRNAIVPISNIKSGTHHFENTGLRGNAHELPPTPEILNLLRSPQVASGVGSAAQETTAGGVSVEDRAKIRQALKELLATHLGPIAGMVFDDALRGGEDFCATPEGRQGLIDKLAGDIDNAVEAADFREKSSAALSRILAQY